MVLIIGIESTAHTFGVGFVKAGKILANEREMYTTEEGGIIPVDSAEHHRKLAPEIYARALEKAGIGEEEIDAISFSQGPGLPPCLLVGRDFSRDLAIRLGKPLVPVNHCVAHLEIGRITGSVDPVLLYCSGANTQVIAYAAGKYRVFGETLDVGVGNFIDNFARYAGLGFPGGPKIEKIALESTAPQVYTQKGHENLSRGPEKSSGKIFTRGKYIELPYRVKGMDIALSGILTNLRQKLGGGFELKDLAYSMQETVFAMLIETAERALAHVGKTELLLGGGVACNSRLQEMTKIMCEERGANFFVPERPLLIDNGAMIAYLGEIMFNAGVKVEGKELREINIKPRERTDQVEVVWH